MLLLVIMRICMRKFMVQFVSICHAAYPKFNIIKLNLIEFTESRRFVLVRLAGFLFALECMEIVSLRQFL